MGDNILSMRPQELKDILFIGIVVDNNDEEHESEVRIRIPKRMDGIPDEHLPWARPLTKGAFFKVPDIGEKVYVEFQQGSPYHPVYYERAIAPNGVNVFSQDYPNTWGISDGKNYIRINKNTNVMEFVNDEGVSVTMGAGNIDIQAPTTYSLNAGENATITTGQNTTINAGQNASITAGLGASITALTADVTATGPVTITGVPILLNNG